MYTHTTGVRGLRSYCLNVPESGFIPMAHNCASKCTVLFYITPGDIPYGAWLWRCKDDVKESW